MSKTTRPVLPEEHRKRRRSVMLTPHQEHFIESKDPTGATLFPRGLAAILAAAGYSADLKNGVGPKKKAAKKTT
jgi:hypothetical protein